MPDPFVNSAYDREPRDFYPTPAWVTECLLPHMNISVWQTLWEPAAGRGDIIDCFPEATVWATDIHPLRDGIEQRDFFTIPTEDSRGVDWIVTNPPFDMIDKFVERCLEHMDENLCSVAILARHNWICGKRRSAITDRLSKVVVLRKRPVWFPERENKAAPIHNFSWYIWTPDRSGRTELVFEG